MKKFKIITYIILMLVLVSSCSNNFMDNTKATTNAYFTQNKKIEYKNQKEIDNEFLKRTYTELSKIEKQSIDIYLDENVETIPYSKFKPSVKTDKVENTNTFTIEYNKEKIDEVAKYLTEKYSRDTVESKVSRENNKLVFDNGVDGLKYDEKTLASNLHIALKNNENYVKIEAYLENQKYDVKSLELCQDVLGTYTTEFKSSSPERIKNLTLASNTINGKILSPNEEFSMNNLLGELTYEKGYVDAPVIIDGKMTDDIAGGVCQVSSTLYNSVLLSELEVTERKNHSTMVGYLPFGFDATIVSGGIDFKFKNNTENLVVVFSEVIDKEITTWVYGVETRPENREIKYINYKTQDLVTDEYEYVLDKEKDTNFKEITQEPKIGYIYEVYKVVYIDDTEVSRELVNESKYKPKKGIITMGENVYNEHSKSS